MPEISNIQQQPCCMQDAGSTAVGALEYRTYTGRTLVLHQNGDLINGRLSSLAIACIGRYSISFLSSRRVPLPLFP